MVRAYIGWEQKDVRALSSLLSALSAVFIQPAGRGSGRSIPPASPFFPTRGAGSNPQLVAAQGEYDPESSAQSSGC